MGWFGLLGRRLSHSYSKSIHSELGRHEYRICEKEPEEVESFVRNGDFDGLNVTIPYKQTVLPYCSELTDAAKSVGSVNTLTRLPGGALRGDNTDCFGFSRLIEKTGVDPAMGKVIVLGSGGSSLTVQYVLREMGAKEVVVISRGGRETYAHIDRHADAAMIVNATPVGMYPDNGASPLPGLGVFRRCLAVVDLIYNPARTELLLEAEDRGITARNGILMLVAQAKKAAELFTGQCIPDEKIDGLARRLESRSRNIALIGMPGCGKTSIGEALARLTGRELVDTDAWVSRAAGLPAADLIKRDGEDAFRQLERDALREAGKQSGKIVATGRGVVVSPQNRRFLRQNSAVVFLDRPLGELPLTDRPLSLRRGIEALAAERLPLYRQWCDYHVPVRGVDETARAISQLLLGETAP